MLFTNQVRYCGCGQFYVKYGKLNITYDKTFLPQGFFLRLTQTRCVNIYFDTCFQLIKVLYEHCSIHLYSTVMVTSSNGKIFHFTGPLCGESMVTGEFSSQRPVTWSFGVFFDMRLNKRLSKQSRRLWFQTPSHSLWRHCNDSYICPLALVVE